MSITLDSTLTVVDESPTARHARCGFFVLDLDHGDPAALRSALTAYADRVAEPHLEDLARMAEEHVIARMAHPGTIQALIQLAIGQQGHEPAHELIGIDAPHCGGVRVHLASAGMAITVAQTLRGAGYTVTCSPAHPAPGTYLLCRVDHDA